MTAEYGEASCGGEPLGAGAGAAEAPGVAVGIAGNNPKQSLKPFALTRLGSSDSCHDLSTTCGGGDDSGSGSASSSDVLSILERARSEIDLAIQRYNSERRLQAGHAPLRGRSSSQETNGGDPPSYVEPQEAVSEEPRPSPGVAAMPSSAMSAGRSRDSPRWLRVPGEGKGKESHVTFALDGVLPGSLDADRQGSKASSRCRHEPRPRIPSYNMEKEQGAITPNGGGSSDWLGSARLSLCKPAFSEASNRVEETNSMSVGLGYPASLPSPSTRRGGWVRRLSHEDEGFGSPLSGFMNLKEAKARRRRPPTRFQQSLKKLQMRLAYEAGRILLIVFDACLVVWEAERAGRQAASLPVGGKLTDEPALLLLSDLLFVLFMVDIVLRYVAEPFDLCIASGNGWTWFNLLTVSTHFLQIIAHHVHYDERSSSGFRIATSAFATLRILRVVSLVQITTSIRHLTLFRELRILVHSLFGALQSLLWCSCMSFLLLVAFGMLFSEGALAFRMQATEPDVATATLMQDFGTVLTSSLSLYKSMSGGVDWGDVYVSLEPLGAGFSFLFIMFIAFATIALLNVATAVFVESTMRRSNSDREMMVLTELNDKREFLESVRKIFEEFETSECGGITKNELRKHLEDPKIGAYFAKLGVDVDHFEKLYNLLDRDNSGFIDLEEFTFGCVRLRGEAKCLDIEDLRRSIKSACKTFSEGMEGMDSLTQGVAAGLEQQKKELHATLDGRLGQLNAVVESFSKDLSGLSQGLAATRQHQSAVGERLQRLETVLHSAEKEKEATGLPATAAADDQGTADDDAPDAPGEPEAAAGGPRAQDLRAGTSEVLE